MFACFQASNTLGRMHLCGGTQNDSIDFWQSQAVFQFGRHMLDAVFTSNFFGFF